MNNKELIGAFSGLGEIMTDAASDSPSSSEAISLRRIMDDQYMLNSWFTPFNVRFAIEALSLMISPGKLESWLNKYSLPGGGKPELTVALVLAGNIPLVGFHDLLCVLASGNRALVKSSSKDPALTRYIADILARINPAFKKMIRFTGGDLTGYDAIIATGSDNTRRYFEYYFGDKPHLFRNNRISVSIVTPETTDIELKLTGSDVFTYFGLGCRNISKLFLPVDFDHGRLIKLWGDYSHLLNHKGWSNNYRYNRAIMEIDGLKFTDGKFFLLAENNSPFSPVSVIHYQYYDSVSKVLSEISSINSKIQCVTGKGFIPCGKAQNPELWDYADNVDTMKFLLAL